MRCLRCRRRERGAVLIVVMGVLAILSLIAAMFGMMMIVELRASRNQSEYEMARQAAHAAKEYLLENLDNMIGALQTEAAPRLCPDPDNTRFCQELNRLGSLRVGFSLHEPDRDPPQHVGIVGTEWTDGLGAQFPGMCDVTAHGHTGDMGDTLTQKQFTSSFQVSLVHLLKSRFDTIGASTDIDTYYGGFTTTSNERLRVARMLSFAVLNYRYGQDGLPGTRGNEQVRHDHIPDFGVWTPYSWAVLDSPDKGAGVPGLFWGRMAAGSNATTIVADTTRLGWRNWPNGLWDAGGTYYVYVATGACRDVWQTILTTTAPATLTVANMGAVPRAGDAFCIVPASNGSSSDRGDGDGLVTALHWPDGAMAAEKWVASLALSRERNTVRRKRTIVSIPAANEVEIDDDDFDTDSAADSFAGFVIRVMDGVGAGQVRRIESNVGTVLTLAEDWTTTPQPTIDETGGSFLAGGGNNLQDVALPQPWMTNEHQGRVLRIPWTGQTSLITANTVDTITVSPAFFPLLGAGTSYQIVYQTYVIESDYMDVGALTGTASNQLLDAGKTWTVNQWRGCVVNIYSDGGPPNAEGTSRLITSNAAATLTLDRDWRTVPGAGALYRIEWPRDDKYRPDTLRGDDRVYHSVADILPVMLDALQDDPTVSFSLADAAKVAGILYDSCKDYLTVTSQRVRKKEEWASVNDWRFDGFDNNDSGVVDDEGTTYEDYTDSASRGKLARELYDRLGLRDWAHASGGSVSTRIRQAAQIVANLIDFRDADHWPTRLTEAHIGETSSFTVYGAEGLHVTEVMATPDRVESTTGGEMADDGVGGIPPAGLVDSLGWDWDGIAGCWRVVDATAPPYQASWVFTDAPGLRAGWYAIRLRGGSADVLTFNDTSVGGGGPATVTMGGVDAAGEFWSYARDGLGELIAVQVVDMGGWTQFAFDITAGLGAEFYGFQLLPIYVEMTNVSRTDMEISRYQITLDSIYGTTNSLTVPGVSTNPLTLPDYAMIAGAAADGRFPINYGFYVVAISQAAYDRQWGDTSGIWGDAAGEDYPVWFAGDRAAGEADDVAADARADALLLDRASPEVKVYRREATVASTGPLMAGGDIDGAIGACDEGVSREKTSPLSIGGWAAYEAVPTSLDLLGSQNKLATVITPPFRTCLNRQYLNATLWTAYTETATVTFAAPAGMAGNSQVFPIVPNRPYPSPAWLGLVPLGNLGNAYEWRTIDPNPTPATAPDQPYKLLGTLMEHAATGGVHARINLNNPSEALRLHAFRTIFEDSIAQNMAYDTPVGRRPVAGWANWDELLNNASVQTMGSIILASREDSGASLMADDFEDDHDEKEEWARRYSAILDLTGMNYRYIVAGFVYDDNLDPSEGPAAQVRIEIDVDISNAADGVQVKQFRYVSDF